jgi:serine/threonine protein kinase
MSTAPRVWVGGAGVVSNSSPGWRNATVTARLVFASLERAMKNDSNSLALSAGLRAALGYYRLVAEIGRGGMASVFLALFPNGDGSSRKVVLKQLHPELAMDDDFRAMFEDEARLATRLHHENVVETYDIYSDVDLCVLVMEFLDGQTLSRIRQRARRVSNVPLSIHLRILAEVLAGLDYVHELNDDDGRPLGIVHRDVTPSNIFVTYDGRVKVVDFGIAKATARAAETRMGVLKGKLAYMSPEAVRGQPVDRRSDIFSVGVMLWEAATGLRMWSDHDEVAVYRRLATGDLPLNPPAAAAAHPELMRIARRALAVDPCQRYHTAEAMRQDIEELLAELGKITRAPALSAYMESFFAVEREKFQAIVEGALARFPTKPVSERRLIANELSESYPALDPSDPPTTVSKPSGGTFRTTAYDLPSERSGSTDFRPRRHALTIAASVAGVAMGVAFFAHAPSGLPTSWVGSLLQGRSNAAVIDRALAAAAPTGQSAHPLPAQAAAGGAHVAPAAAAPPASPLEATARVAGAIASPPAHPTTSGANRAALAPRPQITAVFAARPADARFFLDGEALEGNPITLRRSADDKRHRLRVEAPGYATVWRPLDLDRDISREFELVPYLPPPAAARAARPQETHEDPPKPRRGKRPLDRDDPWSM